MSQASLFPGMVRKSRKFREPQYTSSNAVFSVDRCFRFSLSRTWDVFKPRVVFIMLNPSTADVSVLDPTVRRCLGFAMAWGCGSLEVVNLFALRSTDPQALYGASDPGDGVENDNAIYKAYRKATFCTVAAWGVHGAFRNRGDAVARLLQGHFKCLRVTKDGHPAHPLYLPSNLTPVPHHDAWRAWSKHLSAGCAGGVTGGALTMGSAGAPASETEAR